VAHERDRASLPAGYDVRECQCDAQPGAVGALDRELGSAVLVEILKTESARGPSENLGAGKSPDPLGRNVKMTDAMGLIQDHDSIVRPLECGQQHVGNFGRRAV